MASTIARLGSSETQELSFTTDPYPPGSPMLTREVLKALVEHGLAFCTLTKGGTNHLLGAALPFAWYFAASRHNRTLRLRRVTVLEPSTN